MAERTEAGKWLDRLEAIDNELDGMLTALAQELAECKTQRDALLAACEYLCEAIKLKGISVCASVAMISPTEENMTEQYVEANWQDHVACCLRDAYDVGQATIAKTKR